MPDQKTINKLINTYIKFQSRANRFDEKILVPSLPKWQPPVDFPTGTV